MICEICKNEFKSLSGLHSHLGKTHGVLQKEYYHTFFPRYDKFTGKLIRYKDYHYYFNTDFNTKDSLLDWLKENPLEGREYCLNFLKKRCEEKKVNKIPSHVELKSLFFPSLLGLSHLFEGVDKLQSLLNENNLQLKLSTSVPKINWDDPLSIIIDTREQAPLKFDGLKTDVSKISAGDYAPNNAHFCNLFIERKSLFDLAGTLGNNKERFEREVIRAQSLGFYLVVLVEANFKEAMEYWPRTLGKGGFRFGKKMNGSHMMHEIRDLMTRYDNIQFVFSGNRSRSVDLVEKIFRMGDAAKRVDLEYLKDIKSI